MRNEYSLNLNLYFSSLPNRKSDNPMNEATKLLEVRKLLSCFFLTVTKKYKLDTKKIPFTVLPGWPHKKLR